MKPGDLIEVSGHTWRIRGVHLGGLKSESLIEIENVSHESGWTGEWEYHPAMFVPEVLIREIERLRVALSSIARNTCCDRCQEAAKVAQRALQP